VNENVSLKFLKSDSNKYHESFQNKNEVTFIKH
jgi:hypothetical protein